MRILTHTVLPEEEGRMVKAFCAAACSSLIRYSRVSNGAKMPFS